MTQVILDEMIRADTVLPGIQKWTTVGRLVDLRPNEQIYDDRVPTVLRDLKQPTFVTIDDRFWNLAGAISTTASFTLLCKATSRR
jgi:hypothetical protein